MDEWRRSAASAITIRTDDSSSSVLDSDKLETAVQLLITGFATTYCRLFRPVAAKDLVCIDEEWLDEVLRATVGKLPRVSRVP